MSAPVRCPTCDSFLLMGVAGDLSVYACHTCGARFPRSEATATPIALARAKVVVAAEMLANTGRIDDFGPLVTAVREYRAALRSARAARALETV